MGRNNGTFKFKPAGTAVKDPVTGLYSAGSETDWMPGSECQIEKFVPAKQKKGVDGEVYDYNYCVFIPKYVKCDLTVGTRILILSENGVKDEFSILGVDDLNRKYIEIWG